MIQRHLKVREGGSKKPTFHPGILVHKCIFRWLSHKRRRFGNHKHFDNPDHKYTQDKDDDNDIQHSLACKYKLLSKDGT